MKLDKSEAIPEWISGNQWRRTQVEDWKTPAQRGTEFSQELPLDLIGQTFWPDSLSALKFIFKHKRGFLLLHALLKFFESFDKFVLVYET